MRVEWQDLDANTDTDAAGPWDWKELPAPAHPESFAELGVSPSASNDELHAAYRALLLQHHPDRARPADRDAAEERTKRITLAYRAVLAQR